MGPGDARMAMRGDSLQTFGFRDGRNLDIQTATPGQIGLSEAKEERGEK